MAASGTKIITLLTLESPIIHTLSCIRCAGIRKVYLLASFIWKRNGRTIVVNCSFSTCWSIRQAQDKMNKGVEAFLTETRKH